MKTQFPFALSLALAAFSLPALAHDPKFHHQQGATAPDCSQMKDMDMSKMDPNDPVMKAMQAKCKAATKHDAAAAHDANGHDMKNMPGMDQKAPPPADKDKK